MVPNPYTGKLICTEGIDGSGKTEAFNRLRSYLAAFHPKVKFVSPKEPVNPEIYDVLYDRHPTMKASQMSRFDIQVKLFLPDRITSYRENILPALERGEHVLVDRSFVSSMAYGSETTSDFEELAVRQSRLFAEAGIKFIWPDLVIIYDVDVTTALDRLGKKDRELDYFERKEVLGLTRVNYIKISRQFPKCVLIDGTPDAKSVFETTRSLVFPLLGIETKS